ncbi:MAG: hypothetical protein ACTSUV_01545 [Candidatus Ranarchaeia archaeon]
MFKLTEIFDDNIRVQVLEYLLKKYIEHGKSGKILHTAMYISRDLSKLRLKEEKTTGKFTGRKVSHSSIRLSMKPLVEQGLVVDTHLGGRFHYFHLNEKNKVVQLLVSFYEDLISFSK